MFALEQSSAVPDERRTVIAVAGNSTMLHWLAIAGTHDGLDEEPTAQVDWERVLYRYAADVVALGRSTLEMVTNEGFSARLVGDVTGSEAPTATVGGLGQPIRVWLPEPVSRIAETPSIVRALSDLDAAGMLAEVVLSKEDRDDEVWTGTTWDRVVRMLEAFDAPAVRADGARSGVGAVIFGSPHDVVRDSIPDSAVVFAKEGSAARTQIPGAVPWIDIGDLAGKLAALAGTGLEPPPPVMLPEEALHRGSPAEPNGARARRVSVGVPVYRNVRYLDECVGSLMRQEQPVHELILIDDGSRSAEVTAAMTRWQREHPQRIRVMQQPNRGVCIARNQVLEEMTGDAFVLVDADDVLDSRFVAMCAQAMRSDTRITAVATWTEFFGDYAAIEAKPPFDGRVGLRENPIISTCVLVDMAVRDAGLRFLPDLADIFCEDWALWSAIVAHGGEFGLVPQALARHRVHKASGGFRRSALAQSLGRARATQLLRGPELRPEPE
jgi:GT2 family glycosyltransferase